MPHIQPSGPQPGVATNLGQTIAANRFVLSRRIGKGGFGDVYEGVDIWTNQECAVKLERIGSKKSYLYSEYCIYRKLQGLDGIPEVSWYGTEGPFNIMVTQLLGPSLSDIVGRFKRLSLCSVMKLAIQMLSLVEAVHNRNIIHRDIKPGNFLVGCGEQSGKLFLVDFGLSTNYRHSATGRHIPYNSSAHFHGTDKYASINNHMKIEASRRDDLESIAYTIVYLAKGELPWQHVPNRAVRRKRMGQMKMRILPEELCAGLPRCFEEFLRQSMSLEFAMTPDYSYLRSLFEQTLAATPGGLTSHFEWAQPNSFHLSSSLAPMFYVSPIPTVVESDPIVEDDSLGRKTPPTPNSFSLAPSPANYATPPSASTTSPVVQPVWHPSDSQPNMNSRFKVYGAQEYCTVGFSPAQRPVTSPSSPSGATDDMDVDPEYPTTRYDTAYGVY